MNKTIQITAEDINKGKRKDILNNPAALALRRQLPESREIVVNMHYSRIDGVTYNNPQNLYEFIFECDLGLAVSPIEFKFA